MVTTDSMSARDGATPPPRAPITAPEKQPSQAQQKVSSGQPSPKAAPSATHPDTKALAPETASGPGDADALEEPVYVSGLKLFTIMAAITLPCFLMLLDTSIVVTVSILTWSP